MDAQEFRTLRARYPGYKISSDGQARMETSCVFEIEGHKYESSGAMVTPTHIIAYLGKGGVLTDWHGCPLGTWKTVATWRTQRSWVSGTMSQIEAIVDGVVYTGRGAGEGMIFKGRRKR